MLQTASLPLVPVFPCVSCLQINIQRTSNTVVAATTGNIAVQYLVPAGWRTWGSVPRGYPPQLFRYLLCPHLHLLG